MVSGMDLGKDFQKVSGKIYVFTLVTQIKYVWHLTAFTLFGIFDGDCVGTSVGVNVYICRKNNIIISCDEDSIYVTFDGLFGGLSLGAEGIAPDIDGEYE